VVAEDNADLGRGGQAFRHRAGQEDERVSAKPIFSAETSTHFSSLFNMSKVTET
jgi:hypothetical protein